METNKLIDRLRELSKIGIVNYKHDTPALIEAADRIEELDERIAIMQESMEALEKRNEPMLMAYIGDTADGIEVGICPVCNKTLANDLRRPTKYCKFCGQAVRWND